MDSLSYQMLKMSAACTVTYDKTDLISDLGKTGSNTKNDDFQKLLDKKAQEKDPLTEDRSKAENATAAKKEKVAGQKKEDPAEAAKQMQVYLVPLTPEELSQYPAEWLPQVEEGEPILCIGVTTDANGQQMPILVGANQAEQMYGKPMVAPEEQSQGEIELPQELIQAPEQLEQAVVEEKVPVMETVEEAQPQQQDDAKVEITDAEQAPQRLFHDVKAAPVKVGEVYDAQQTEEPDVVSQVDTAIARALENGESTITVSLNPENLGEITVQMSVKTGGTLAVAISVHNDDTKTLLERHAANLQELLSSRVKESVEVDIQRGQESQQNQQQQQNYEGHNGHAQDSREERRQQHREHSASSQDFMQQLRLGLIPSDGEA